MPDFWPWGIAAAAIGIAYKVVLDRADFKRSLDRAMNDIKVLEAEKSALNKIVDQHKEKASDEFTKKLPYPRDSNR